MFLDNEYAVQKCKVHKITIHYLVKRDNIHNETQCWDCIREANNKKFAKEMQVTRLKERFYQEYSELYSPNTTGGIVSVKVSDKEIDVSIEDSTDACSKLPDQFEGRVINKVIVGASYE